MDLHRRRAAARTGTTPVSVGWRGETHDKATGLIWLRARWYDPTTARFLSADPWHGDPANPISLNRYVYANADPVNMHDPTGLQTGTLAATSTAQLVFDVLVGIGAVSLTVTRVLNSISNDDDHSASVANYICIPERDGVVVHQSHENREWCEQFYPSNNAAGWLAPDEGVRRGLQCTGPADHNQPFLVNGSFPGDGGGTVRARDVRFVQNTADYGFKKASLGNIDDLRSQIDAEGATPSTMDAIVIFQHCGRLYTLDHRRLIAAQMADVEIPFRWATTNELRKTFKFTTKNSGTSIDVVDENGETMWTWQP